MVTVLKVNWYSNNFTKILQLKAKRFKKVKFGYNQKIVIKKEMQLRYVEWFLKRRSWKINNPKYDLTKYTILFGSRFETGGRYKSKKNEELAGWLFMQPSAYISDTMKLTVLKQSSSRFSRW
jgi:hypothetical protein